MATDLAPQQNTPAPPKYELLIEQQLDKARRRIRNLDTLSSVLILLIGVLLYALGMSALDRAFTLPTEVRVMAFLVAALAALGYGGLICWRLFQWRVNPYYAARRLEATLPDAKNSLVNWLDLRDEPVAPVIRGNLGRRAAKDATSADLESAVNARRPVLLAGLLGVLVLVLFVWFLTGPGQLVSLLARAFAPFEKTIIAARTTITLINPPNGDAQVPMRQDVVIRVQVTGRIPRVNQPDALRLHFRYRQRDPYIVRPLEEDADGQWSRTLVPDDVQDGFWYKVTGGDAETREFRIVARPQPQVMRFDVTYKYRPYLRRADTEARYGPTESIRSPDLKAERSTQVTLTTRTNRTWQSGSLAVQQGPTLTRLKGEPVTDDPQARRFQFVLDRAGSFQVLFTSTEGEPNVDRGQHRIDVIDDAIPTVKLTEPGKTVELPANGTLKLKGGAQDDFGIKSMTLRLGLKQGDQTLPLAPKPYREGVDFKLKDGTYRHVRPYQDLVALEKLKDAKGKPFAVTPGMEIEYWLEAVDNCDYPDGNTGNVGRSAKYLVKIVAPKDQKKQDQERRQAEKEQQQHEQQQDKEQAQRNKEAEKRERDKGKSPEELEKERQKERDDFEKRAKEAADAIEKAKQENESKGEARSDGQAQPKGEPKQNPDQKEGAGEARGQDKQPKEGEAGQKKEGKGAKQGDEGQAKGAGQPEQKAGQSPQGNGKTEGQPDPKAGPNAQAKDDKGASKQKAPSQAKGGQPQTDKQPEQQQGAGKPAGDKQEKAEGGKARDAGKQGAEQKAGGTKQGGGKDGQPPQAAQAKGDGNEKGGQPQQTQTAPKQGPQDGKNEVAQSKQAGKDGQQADASKVKNGGQQSGEKQVEQRAQGEARGQKDDGQRGTTKQPGEQSKQGDGSKTARAKDDGTKGATRGNGQAQDKKTSPDQSQRAGAGKAERDGDEPKTAEGPRREATKEDVARLEKELQRPEQREDAAQELDELRRQAKDPEVKKAAEEALQRAGESARNGTGKAKGQQKSDNQVAKTGPTKQGPPEKGQQGEAGECKGGGEKEGESGKGRDGGDPTKQEATDKGQTKQGTQTAGNRTGKGTRGSDDNLKPNPVDEEAARRAGELQLENLKKKLQDPVVQKQLREKNWAQEDIDRFLQQAREYQQWLRQNQQAASDEKPLPPGAGKNVLPSQAPRQVRQGPNATRDPLNLGQALPPPEFRQAQRQFTGKKE